MRLLILLSAVLVISNASAVEPLDFDFELGENWTRSDDSQSLEGWTFRTWRDKSGDLLTVASNSRSRKLNTYADLDRAMDFATSAYPDWLKAADFQCWSESDDDPRFLKLELEGTRNGSDGNYIPKISYVLVNGNVKRSFMAVGIIFCIDNVTYYIQHNTARHVSDDLISRIVRKLVVRAKVKSGATNTEPADARESPN